MSLLALDPGPAQTGLVEFDVSTSRVLHHRVVSNDAVLQVIMLGSGAEPLDHLAIEMIASYGMSVGKTVFETCIWIGRYIQAWGGRNYTLIPRHDVKMTLCHTKNSSNANVREALIDRWGGVDVALGNKKIVGAPKIKGKEQRTPAGPLFGIASHEWSALAVAVTWSDLHGRKAA